MIRDRWAKEKVWLLPSQHRLRFSGLWKASVSSMKCNPTPMSRFTAAGIAQFSLSHRVPLNTQFAFQDPIHNLLWILSLALRNNLSPLIWMYTNDSNLLSRGIHYSKLRYFEYFKFSWFRISSMVIYDASLSVAPRQCPTVLITRLRKSTASFVFWRPTTLPYNLSVHNFLLQFSTIRCICHCGSCRTLPAITRIVVASNKPSVDSESAHHHNPKTQCSKIESIKWSSHMSLFVCVDGRIALWASRKRSIFSTCVALALLLQLSSMLFSNNVTLNLQDSI